MDRRIFRMRIVMFIGSIIRWYRGDYNISIIIIIIITILENGYIPNPGLGIILHKSSHHILWSVGSILLHNSDTSF